MSQTWLQFAGTYEEELYGSEIAITANAAGGQAAATQLTAKFNRIDTVAVQNASVKLPTADIGKKCFILNNAGLEALVVAVFPQSGEYIDGVLDAFDTTYSIYTARIPGLGGKTYYECFETGYWTSVVSPKIFSLQERVTLSQAQIQTSNATPIALLAQYGQMIIDPQSVIRSSTNGSYATNTIGQITSDYTGVKEPHFEFDYDLTFTDWKKCVPNANGAYIVRSQGLYFRTKTGNPTGAGGAIKFIINYKLYLD